MVKKHRRALWLLCLAFCLSLSCSQINLPGADDDDDDGGGGGGGEGFGTPTANNTLDVVMTAIWEFDASNEEHAIKTCTISDSSPLDVACEAQIPEGQQFHSKIRFEISMGEDMGCERIIFQPYFYFRSQDNAYTAPGATSPVDCSVAITERPVACFDGPAKDITSNFPKSFAMYFVPVMGATAQEYIAPSANTARLNYSEAMTNRWAGNELVDRNTSQSGAGFDFLGATDAGRKTFYDWTFTCMDLYDEELHVLTITVNDVDNELTTPPPLNDYTSWDTP